MKRQAFAEDNQAVWTIKIIGATGLKNTDWGPNGVSDPFVDIYIHSTNGNHFNDKTPVIFNNINPQWNYSVKREYSADETIFTAIFVVWDQDNIGNRFLGVAELKNPIPGREYSLALHRKRLLNTPTEPGKRLLPGTLKVKVTVKSRLVKVPNLKGKTEVDAQNELKTLGLKPARTGQSIVHNKNKVGRVIGQRPSAGENAQLGGMVYYYIGRMPTYSMPNVIGYSIPDAIRTLRFFKNVQITYKSPSLDTPRERWMKISEQSPASGQGQFAADTEIRLIALRPPDNFKIIIPDVIGDSPNDAARSLREAKAPSVQWKKERIADESKNNIVVTQSPLAGTAISWSEKSPISIGIGWYANGKSLYAAKPTKLETPFDVTFDKPETAEYRLIEITDDGYLILKDNGGEGSEKLTPLSNYYRYANGWEKVNDRRYHLPSAQRVTPGQWVVQMEPEIGEITSKNPCHFEFSFIKEFDPAEPNDTFDQAVEITPDAEAILGFMGADDNDFYSFEIKTPGYLEVSFKELPSELIDSKTEQGLLIRYSLYNEQKEGIESYYLPSAVFLSPGKYYIDISSGEGLWNRLRYKFTLQFHGARDVGEPNDTKETAYEVEVGKTIPVAYSIDDTDYYRIKSDEPGYAVLSHDINIPFDVGFDSYDKEGHEVDSVMYLPAAVKIDGERLVSLSAASEGTRYLVDPPAHLQIGFISEQEDPYEPNDSPEEAAPIKLNQTIKGLLMPRFELDNYSFTVKKPGVIYFDLTKPEGEDIPIKGRLLSSDGETVVADNLDLPCEVNIDKPGKYILQFKQESGLQRLCDKQYKLVIRDGGKESASDNKMPSERYGKKGTGDCLESARQAYELLQKAQYKQAKDLYAQALQCASKNAVVWNDYAVSCFNLKETKTAEESLNEAIKLDPDYDLAYRNLAVVNWQKGDNAKGAEMMAKAVTLKALDENLRYAAHAYVLLSKEQKGQNKIQSLKKAAEYYRKMKNIPESSRDNLDKIEKYLKGKIALPEK